MATKRREKDSPSTTRFEKAGEHTKILLGENRELRENLKILNDVQTKLSRLSERQEMINRIGRDLTILDLKQVAAIAVSKSPQIVGAKYCSLYLYHKSEGDLELLAHNHPAEIANRIPVGFHPNTVMGRALQGKTILHIADIDEYEARCGLRLERMFAGKYETKTCMSCPLVSGEDIIGILNFADKIEVGAFDEVDDLPVAEQIARLVTMSIRNCLLFNMVQNQALTDPLTLLANRRAFQQQLTNEVRRALRYNRPLSMQMIDIDRFKEINDSMGHPAGDVVLKEVSSLIRSLIRREDFPARYGGDEIVIVLPETPMSGAVVLGGRIVAAIRNAHPVYEGKPIQTGISMGIAALTTGMSIDDFLKSADSALYEAKRQGKDRYVVASVGL